MKISRAVKAYNRDYEVAIECTTRELSLHKGLKLVVDALCRDIVDDTTSEETTEDKN